MVLLGICTSQYTVDAITPKSLFRLQNQYFFSNQLARVGTSKHTPGAYVCVSSEAWTTVGENCVELCSSGCRPASVGQL